jgi:hypothetical protein
VEGREKKIIDRKKEQGRIRTFVFGNGEKEDFLGGGR